MDLLLEQRQTPKLPGHNRSEADAGAFVRAEEKLREYGFFELPDQPHFLQNLCHQIADGRLALDSLNFLLMSTFVRSRLDAHECPSAVDGAQPRVSFQENSVQVSRKEYEIF